MSIPSGKKILLIGFVIVLLIAIPLAIYLISQQQKSSTTAVPSTHLSLTPSSQSVEVGATSTFDINIDPGTNSVSFVKLLLAYDATKFATDGAGFVPNAGVFSSVIQGPNYGPGTISVTLSIGANSPPVTSPSKLGSLTLKTIAPTDASTTQITFGNQTQVLSTGATDQFNENVLSTTTPATITINGTISPTPTPTLEITPSPTPATPVATDSASTTTNNSIVAPASAAEAPTCLSFTADRALTGVAPFNVNFTMVGTSSANILKATFNFGDGQIKELTQADGIGPTSLNSLTSHIYNTSGSFSAFGTITDVNGAISQVGTCTLILNINPSSTDSAQVTTPAVSPLPPTGPSNIVFIGMIGLLIIMVGAVLVFAL
jgi:hypothetical protein